MLRLWLTSGRRTRRTGSLIVRQEVPRVYLERRRRKKLNIPPFLPLMARCGPPCSGSTSPRWTGLLGGALACVGDDPALVGRREAMARRQDGTLSGLNQTHSTGRDHRYIQIEHRCWPVLERLLLVPRRENGVPSRLTVSSDGSLNNRLAEVPPALAV